MPLTDSPLTRLWKRLASKCNLVTIATATGDILRDVHQHVTSKTSQTPFWDATMVWFLHVDVNDAMLEL